MSVDSKKVIRCAIYTRKSSEEGLEQSFNSLDAQREACHAFIASQRQEGWRALPNHYDDGGYSGGTLERPGLKQLLKDIESEKVDTIVVYKVDRLTRSLADFAKIVEALDARGVSFVSVTQQFNTTSSMGRLTLNVLLSFAQFEREVTGERIRDKIAASKRKGMWMGGVAPLGYDVRDKKLLVNAGESKEVLRLFKLYLDLGCVSKLKLRLDAEKRKSKARVSKAGNQSGGTAYSRGALYQILKNRVYVGEIHHRGQNYVGEHQAIIPRELWEAVQLRMKSDNQGRKTGLKSECPSLLVGILQDAEGNRFIPSHTLKAGKRYRYYVCQKSGRTLGASGRAIRLPAHDVERQVFHRLKTLLQSPQDIMDVLNRAEDDPAVTQGFILAAPKQANNLSSNLATAAEDFIRKVVRRVVVHADRIEIQICKDQLRNSLLGAPMGSSKGLTDEQTGSDNVIQLDVEGRLKRCGIEMRLVVPGHLSSQPCAHPVPSLVRAVARGRQWHGWVTTGEVSGRRSIAKKLHINERYVRRVLECAFLAPDIVEAILDGRQPTELTFKKLTNRLPLSWVEQRKQLGFRESQLG
jgi:site-specific DNA recombinase